MTPCRWCGCIDYHAEMCEGFKVNDPANSDSAHSRDSLAHRSRRLRPSQSDDQDVSK